jgi:hypothetical protein
MRRSRAARTQLNGPWEGEVQQITLGEPITQGRARMRQQLSSPRLVKLEIFIGSDGRALSGPGAAQKGADLTTRHLA